MLLAIDMGNTCITLGVYNQSTLRMLSRLATDINRTDDQYAVELRDVLDIHGIGAKDIDAAIICSVVPFLTSAIQNAVHKIANVEAMLVGPGVKSGLNIKIDNPAQLGADMVAGAVAAIDRYPLPCILYDLGTATTISVIGRDGAFLGGTITAGVGISLDALVMRTSQLPYISPDDPERVIGTNTITSMKSGLSYGTASMMDGMADRIEEELGEKATLVATGGRAQDILRFCRREILLDETLLLDGLRLIFERSRKG